MDEDSEGCVNHDKVDAGDADPDTRAMLKKFYDIPDDFDVTISPEDYVELEMYFNRRSGVIVGDYLAAMCNLYEIILRLQGFLKPYDAYWAERQKWRGIAPR